MAKPIQLFLQWEIRVKLDFLHEPLNRFTRNADAYNAAVMAQLPVTVNQFRRDLGLQPHPDERGGMFVYAVSVDKPTDNTIPDGLLKMLWTQIIENESKIQVGRRSLEELSKAYPELYAAVNVVV